MKLSLAVLLAVAFAAAATPAAACGLYSCAELALASDAYPPGETPLPPYIEELVKARQDKGMSLAGFYNDPTLALARREAPPVMYYGARRAQTTLRRAY